MIIVLILANLNCGNQKEEKAHDEKKSTVNTRIKQAGMRYASDSFTPFIISRRSFVRDEI